MTDERRIVAIWFRVLQPGEFFNIERGQGIVEGGGGSLYIEIPRSLTEETLDFFGQDMPTLGGLGFTIDAYPIGGVGGEKFPITVMPKSNQRLRIANQNRQATPNRRHPAWSAAAGFPQAPNSVRTTDEASAYMPAGGVRVFVAKLDNDEFLAGFTQGEAPDDIAKGDDLHRLYINKGVGGVLWNIELPVSGG